MLAYYATTVGYKRKIYIKFTQRLLKPPKLNKLEFLFLARPSSLV